MEYNINKQNEETEDAAIRIDGLTVRYRMPDVKISSVKEYIDKLLTRKLKHKEFVALNNLSLTIKKGQRVGIIGHNGAGKSTLLKVIARVIKPSGGTLEVNGSIAPLLELGAGFDLELTGVENIYLNGSILGKSKKYLDMVREDIINFAELGEFIDYPVKNYSSGMRAKLGFAIATQVDSDILLVDEVFGVGDENFKRKSKAKMVEMINSGKTVIIVSHDMTQMVDLTERVIWMNNGEIVADGSPQDICDQYCAYMLEHQNVVVESRKARTLLKEVKKEGEKREQIKKDAVKSKVGNLVKKVGMWDRLLNDPVAVKELIYDRRVMANIKSDEMIVQNILETREAFEAIINNDDMLCEILQSEEAESRIKENPLLFIEPVKKVHKLLGQVDVCAYYKNSGLLYVKGLYMPVDAYTDIKIYMGDEYIGEAQIRLNRTVANKAGGSLLDRFSGWEFLSKVALASDKIEISVWDYEVNVAKSTVEIELKNEEAPKDLIWKCENKYTQEYCWELYRRYIISGFNMMSFRMQQQYNRLLEEQESIGWLYKKNYYSEESEIGFRLVTNSLGLRGPADSGAGNVVLGGGVGLAFGVDEDAAWYADDFFQQDWINLCYACEPKQLQRLIKKSLKKAHKPRRAIMLYEASFWSIGTSKEITADKGIISLQVDEAFAKEKENFFSFFNKVYEGIYKIAQGNNAEKLLNSQYAKFDFGKNAGKCDYLIREWKSILEEFDEVVVLRIPNKEYLYAEKTKDGFWEKLKHDQDEGWGLFKEKMSENKKITFFETDVFTLSDYLFATGFLNEQGNDKLKDWIIGIM